MEFYSGMSETVCINIRYKKLGCGTCWNLGFQAETPNNWNSVVKMISIVFAIWAAELPRIHIPLCVNTIIRNVGHIFWHSRTSFLTENYTRTLQMVCRIYSICSFLSCRNIVLQIYMEGEYVNCLAQHNITFSDGCQMELIWQFKIKFKLIYMCVCV